MSKRVVDLVRAKFGDGVISSHDFRGDDTVVVKRDVYREVIAFLKETPGTQMDFFVDLTCVDWPDRDPRFELVVHLKSHALGHRVRVKVGLPASDPLCHSIVDLYVGANWFEREAWDLYGVRFDGHPDLRRILLYEEFVGHTLRKDYPKDGRQPLVPEREGAPAQPPPFPERSH
jgi:NADH-quinone oxidoreductase subunit C